MQIITKIFSGTNFLQSLHSEFQNVFEQNGATGQGGTAAYKHGYDGLWADECDISGLGVRNLPPCLDDNDFASIIPIGAQGIFATQ